MIRIALCDDNELQLEVSNAVLENYLQNKSEEVNVELFRKGEELIKQVREKKGQVRDALKQDSF